MVSRKRFKPSDKFIVAGFKDRLSAPSDANASDFVYWRSFSPFWWSLVQSLIAGLDQPYIWENYTEDLQQQIIDLMLPQEPDCPECPEPEPPEQPPSTPSTSTSSGGGLSPFGQITGLTANELEVMLGMSIRDIKIENGKMYKRFWGDDCDCWHLVGDITSLVQNTTSSPTTLGALAATEQGLKNALQALPLPTLPTMPIKDPALANGTSAQCVKATAMKYALQTFFVDMRDFLEEYAASDVGTIIGVITGLAKALVPIPPIAAIAGLASWLTSDTVDNLTSAINSVLADSDFWNNFVCTLTLQLDTAQHITGKDMSFMFDLVFAELNHVASVIGLLNTIVPDKFQQTANYFIGGVGCECEQYLPYGYIPQLPPNAIQFQFSRFLRAMNSTTGAAAYSGTIAYVQDAAHGVLGANAGEYRETSFGTISSTKYAALHAWFAFNKVVTITQVKMTLSLLTPSGYTVFSANGTVAVTGLNGAADQIIGHFSGGFPSSQVLPYSASYPATLTTPMTRQEFGIAVLMNVPSTQAAPTFKISNVLVSGSVSGQPFVDLALNEVRTL